MDDTTRRENEQFENEVQRIARALWPHAEFSGATTLGGREIDGVFETEDCTHVVEATTSRKRQKAQQDVEKLNLSLTKIQARREFHPVRGWFVTRDEPTADQRTITYKYRDRIRVLSFSQFQARLIESKTYLSARDDYAFGSVRDPATGAHDPRVQYVGLDLEDVSSQRVVPRKDLLSLLDSGRTVVLLGDYGAGKSMTLREVYRDLRARHLRGQSSTFPVYLNLRDHYGQTDPAEVIERHGKSIGFSHPSHLVRAWRAGYVHLLIDGFDEISTMNIQGLWRQLRDSRFRAMGAVRRMIREHTEHSRRAGLLVAGRAHFFDSPTELRKALGLAPNTKELLLSEFTAEQIATYLENAGLAVFVPSWLPSRPLLVGYLAAHGLLDDLANGESGAQHVEPAVGWHTLIDRVTVREAEIEPGIDGSTVRRILERLATKARASQGGLGSLSPDSVVQAFSDICGYSPDERGMVLLQRLPGLGVDREEENSRTFVDEAFADACRAGDLVRFIENPFGEDQSELADMTSSIGQLGIQVTAHRAAKEQFTEGKINAALASARRSEHRYVVADLARLLLKIGYSVREQTTIGPGVFISDLELGVGVGDADFSRLEFQDCFFSRVKLDPDADDDKIPSFRECFIHKLEGRVSVDDLPQTSFDEKCIIESFTGTADTTATVLTLDLPLGTRVCLTVLKKLYEQSGSGRKENALHRGLDSHARRLVPGVLHILQSEGLALPDRSRGTTIWRPDRGSRTRVGRVLAAPATENDHVLDQCAGL